MIAATPGKRRAPNLEETPLKPIRTFALPALAILAGAAFAFTPGVLAQNTPGSPQSVTVADPAGPPPDPAHIPFTLPKDLKWTGRPGQQETASLYGDPGKPGPYAVLIKWYPGNFSRPHFHDKDRWIYVVSGTWWVSSSNVFDIRKTYPFRAGTQSQDVANTVHFDGARLGEKEPAVILLAGIGPVKSVSVDENGKPRQGDGH
jgi:hypothetical protein